MLLELKRTLREIRKNHDNYDYRMGLIWRAVGLASELGYPIKISPCGDVEGFLSIGIYLPVGWVSWVMRINEVRMTSHDTNKNILKFTVDKRM